MLRGLRAGALEPVDLLGDRVVGSLGGAQLGELGAVLGDHVAVAFAELLADRFELLAQQILALLAVDTLGDVVADRLGDLQLGDVAARRVEHQLHPLPHVDGGEHGGAAVVVEVRPGGDPVGEGAGMVGDAQQLGQPPRSPQLGDDAEDAAQLASERLDARGWPRVADHLGVGVGGAALGGVERTDAGAALDAHDGGGVAGRQRADVGNLGDDGDLAAAGVQQHPRVAGPTGGGDGGAQLVGTEGEGDDSAGEDDGGDRGDGEANGGGGGRRCGGIAHVLEGSDLLIES